MSEFDSYQKSEGCWCGERLNAEGTAEAVLLACGQFRRAHSHREKVSPADVATVGAEAPAAGAHSPECDRRDTCTDPAHGVGHAIAAAEDRRARAEHCSCAGLKHYGGRIPNSTCRVHPRGCLCPFDGRSYNCPIHGGYKQHGVTGITW